MAFTSKVLALVARVLGKQYNIKIAMGNYQTASTDGKTIFIPMVKGEAAVDFARGYIDHEAAHIRLTDFNFMPTNDFRGQLLNVIEDIRIEKAIGKDYPGCASNLRRLDTVLEEKYGVFKPNPANPSSSILAWISCRGRVDSLAHDSMVASALAAEPAARAIFGQHFAEAQRLVAMIGRLPEDKSGTRAAAKLRDDFMVLLEQAKDDMDNQPEPQPEPQEQEKEENKDGQKQDQPESSDTSDSKDTPSDSEPGEPGEEGEGGDKKDDQGDEEQDKDGSPSKSDSSDNSDSESDTDDSAESDEGGEGKDEGESETDDGPTDATDSEDGGESEGEGGGSDAGSDDGADGDDQSSGESASNGGSKGDSEGDDGGESQNQSQGSSAGLGPAEMQAVKDALEEALGNESIEFGDIGQLLQELLGNEAITSGAELAEIPKLPECVPHPGRHAAEFTDLHLVKTHTAKLRAQLQGLIQASKLKRSIPRRVGRKLDNRTLTRLSVGDDRLFISREEKKGVNTAVLLILDGSGSMDYQRPGHKMHTATRACFVALEAMYSIPGVTAAAVEFNSQPNTVFNLCGWGQKPDSKIFNHDGSGGTELSTALWLGWGELVSRPETRKIAVIFSDGDTSCSDITPSHLAIRRMKQDGIELVGIGIQDSNLKQYLPRETQVINDLSQLTPALLELLREKLVAA
ncbi:vWA domain-containing protein [Geomonas subterranea]|uniref:vWA domain-containing protein n=1 Tax=Geomonas subterranea TaxID=2847989 RepID=UPI001CD293BD|nr:VWA domain-containing protein [Geomonas fuzhouensis]